MSNFDKTHPTRRGWFWKLCRTVVNSFVMRRSGDAPLYDEETPSEALERVVREGASEGSKYRASHKFQVQLVFEFWKAVLHQGRQVTSEDEEYVRKFIDENISAQIPNEERAGYWKYYHDLNPDEIKFRNVCYLLKTRTRPELRLKLTDAIYRFAYSRAFEKQKIVDIDFYCQMMEVPSDRIRQADFAAKHWFEEGEEKRESNSEPGTNLQDSA